MLHYSLFYNAANLGHNKLTCSKSTYIKYSQQICENLSLYHSDFSHFEQFVFRSRLPWWPWFQYFGFSLLILDYKQTFTTKTLCYCNKKLVNKTNMYVPLLWVVVHCEAPDKVGKPTVSKFQITAISEDKIDHCTQVLLYFAMQFFCIMRLKIVALCF